MHRCPQAMIRAVRTMSAWILMLALLALAPPAFAQAEAAAPAEQQITETTAAALLLEAGQIDDAKRVLAHVLETNPNDYEARFLRGLIAVSEKR